MILQIQIIRALPLKGARPNIMDNFIMDNFY
jgi:hypothetical protein